MNKTSAILIFSRSAPAEAKAKPLSYATTKAEKIADALIQQTKNIAEATNLPIFVITEKQQRGADFGERLSNAFSDIFQKGFDSVIAIGNDCLDISPKNLLDAASVLEENPLVLGETTDGGVYLMGLNHSAYKALDFSAISWQTPKVFAELCFFFENKGFPSVFLDKKADFDTPFEFFKAVKTSALRFQKIVLALLFDTCPIHIPLVQTIPNPIFLSTQSLRAPPILAHL